MKERLRRDYLAETVLFYNGFELDEKKKEKENSMVFRVDSREFFSLFLEGIFK